MRDEALCFSREIRWMFVAVHLRPPRNNKIYLNPSWMESCNGHKHKIPPYFQTLIPIKMHEVRRRVVIMVGIIFIVIWSAKTLVRTDSGVRSRDSESETGTPTIRAGVSTVSHRSGHSLH